MYKNRNSNGKLNLCGEKIQLLRKQMTPKVSQRALADKLQLAGIDLDKNAIQRIESGQRFVTILSCGLSLKFFRSPQISSSKIISRNYLQGRGISFRLRIPSDYLIGKGAFPNVLKHLSISVFRPFLSSKHGGAGQNSDKHLK